MSRHEGVSCDSCLTNNFGGRRYKCLICYDFDLCAQCHDMGVSSSRHGPQHPMQCILTRSDFEIFYGGDILSMDLSQSLTCPHCGKMGFVEASLSEHVTAQHSAAATQVVCPICASVPNGEPNHVTDDLAGHLEADHRCHRDEGPATARDLVSFDEPLVGRNTRRLPLSSRGLGGPRLRRFNNHQRESMDPITELLSQLSGVRRVSSANSSASNPVDPATVAQMQQLQMQLQLEHQQCIERLGSGDRPSRRRITLVPSRSVSALPVVAAPALQSNVSTLQAPAVSWLHAAGVPAAPLNTGEAQENSSKTAFLIRDTSMCQAVCPVTDIQDKAFFVQDIIYSALTKSFAKYVSISEPKSVPEISQTSPSYLRYTELSVSGAAREKDATRTATTTNERAETQREQETVEQSLSIRPRGMLSTSSHQCTASPRSVITMDFSRRKLPPRPPAALLVEGGSVTPADKSGAAPVSG